MMLGFHSNCYRLSPYVIKLNIHRSLNSHFIKETALIGSGFNQTESKKKFPVYNPATGEKLAYVSDCSSKDVDNAIDCAFKAFQSWRFTTGRERGQLIRKLYEGVIKHTDDLAEIITAENGKPFKEAKVEVTYAANFLEWFSEEARRIDGDIINSPIANRRILILRQPVGVTGMITPFNFPLAMATRKLGACLAAGCTAVLKPAQETPLTALALGQLTVEAGFPTGVFQVVTTDGGESVKRAGKQLCTSPKIRKITFTGSIAVGKVLLSQCADSVKKVSLELGGNAPFIVFPSADLEAAVKGAMASKFRASGQTCVCANRILVHADLHDEFVRRLSEAISRELILGNGMHPDVTQGPLINESAIEKVDRIVQNSVSAGAKVVIGGKRAEGLFYEPTILCNVNSEMDCMKDEIFGPVAPIQKFSSEEEAIALSNATKVGLGGYFYSRDLGQIWRVAERLEVGILGVNEGLLSTVEAPFGGVKESGLGREGSKYGVNDYLEMKYVCLGGL